MFSQSSEKQHKFTFDTLIGSLPLFSEKVAMNLPSDALPFGGVATSTMSYYSSILLSHNTMLICL